MVVMDQAFSCGKTIRLAAVYTSSIIGQNKYFRDLEKFQGMSHSLIFLGDAVWNAHVDYAGPKDSQRNVYNAMLRLAIEPMANQHVAAI